MYNTNKIFKKRKEEKKIRASKKKKRSGRGRAYHKHDTKKEELKIIVIMKRTLKITQILPRKC